MKNLIATLLLTFLSTCAAATTTPSRADSEAKIQATVSRLSQGKAQLVRIFPGVDGLVGAIVKDASGQHVAWTTPNGEALLTGSLLAANGTDLTHAALVEQGLQLSPAAALHETQTPSRHAILVGTKGPWISVVFDPNCIYCHQLYGKLLDEVTAGHMRVRFLIVGTLKESSIPRAVSILAASNPAKALDKDEDQFDLSQEEGGYPIAKTLDPSLKSAVEDNNFLFTRAGLVGTPAIFYCKDHKPDAQVLMGLPPDTKAFASGLTACN